MMMRDVLLLIAAAIAASELVRYLYGRSVPRRGATGGALLLGTILDNTTSLLKRLNTMALDLTKLQQAVADIQADESQESTIAPQLVAVVSTLNTQIAQLIADHGSSDSQADVDALVSKLQDAHSTGTGVVAALQALLPAPVTPAVTLVGDTSGTVGGTIQLAATTNDGAGVAFSSSDTTIATVDDKGAVTLVAAGSVTITATSSTGAVANQSITVSASVDG